MFLTSQVISVPAAVLLAALLQVLPGPRHPLGADLLRQDAVILINGTTWGGNILLSVHYSCNPYSTPSSNCSARPCAMSLVLYMAALLSLALSLSSRPLSIPRLDTTSSTASRLLRWLEEAERLTRPDISSSPHRSWTFDPEMLRTFIWSMII